MTDGYQDWKISPRAHHLEHYYGDRVRLLFFICAVLSFIAIPVWGNLLPISLVSQITGGLVFVLLAGLTNPHNKPILIADAVAAALGALILETTAVLYRNYESLQLLALREVEVILLLGAFYFSVKTARAMMLGKIGQVQLPSEFETPEDLAKFK